jgi:nitrate reductase NapD
VLKDGIHVISSAVVSVLPGRQGEVLSALAALPDTEVAAAGVNNKIVVLLEGRSRGDVGARLAQIALMGGVVTASMVFEHVE